MSSKPITARYERPVEAKLVVKLGDGGSWDATPADLERFGYVNAHEVYFRFDEHLGRILTAAGLIDRPGDITNAALNPLRYLVELAVTSPGLLSHRETAETDRRVVAIERLIAPSLDAIRAAGDAPDKTPAGGGSL